MDEKQISIGFLYIACKIRDKIFWYKLNEPRKTAQNHKALRSFLPLLPEFYLLTKRLSYGNMKTS